MGAFAGYMQEAEEGDGGVEVTPYLLSARMEHLRMHHPKCASMWRGCRQSAGPTDQAKIIQAAIECAREYYSCQETERVTRPLVFLFLQDRVPGRYFFVGTGLYQD